MIARRPTVATIAVALAASIISGCSASSTLVPSSAMYGTLESSRMTPQMHEVLISKLHQKIKYVFVIFQENHSFDNYFGTFPGAENLGTALAKSHGFTQFDSVAKRNQTVFKITNPDILGPDQDRYILENKFNGGRMNNFLTGEEQDNINNFGVPPAQARQFGLTTMAVYDCDTIPYLWQYAKNFALFDHYFQSETGPSSPGNVSMIAGQAGISQEKRFPSEASNRSEGPGVPINGDLDPFSGPYTGTDTTVQIPQSYATLAMTLGGSDEAKSALVRPGKVDQDLQEIANSNTSEIPWAWFQEGFNATNVADKGYVAHHNAPQYFDYVRQNHDYWRHVGTTESALQAIRSGTLSDSGGVFFIKGSKNNHFGWKPSNPVAAAMGFLGDDDHPGSSNSDHAIGEAFVATYVNAIASSKYWNQSAIIVTWDDGGGFFDHVTPTSFESCNDGLPCGDGQRVPLILISPYARSGAVVTDYSDTVSVPKFVEVLFGLRTMASLPDERIVAPFGPRDTQNAISDLAGAFDPEKLDGTAPLNPPIKAEVPAGFIGRFPAPMSCKSLGITPIAIPTQPPYYNPLGSTSAATIHRIENKPEPND